MPTTQIQPNNEVPKTLRVTTFYKELWSDEWTHAPHWQPVHAVKAAAPAFGSATFRLLYGDGKWEDATDLKDGTELDTYVYYYVQIRGYYGEHEIILWTGIIPTENFRLLGKSNSQGTATADQFIQAVSLDALLETRIDGGWVRSTVVNDIVWIDELQTFNRRYEFGGSVIGNRSHLKMPVQREEWLNSINSYFFAPDQAEWGNYDIVEYLIQNYQFYNGPQFSVLAADENEDDEIITSLNQLVDVYSFHATTTIRQALNMLISRSRGFSWRYDVDADDNVSIVPFSLLDEPIGLGSIHLPANPNKLELDLWEHTTQVTVDVTQDIRPTYDRIIVRGAKIKSCCSLRSFDSSLEKAWTDEEEVAFQLAAKDTEGYSSLNETEKAELNDKYRSTDKFSRVYTTFRVPRIWDWVVGNWAWEKEAFVNPKRKSDGLLYLNEQGPYWTVDKRLLPKLPLVVGIDYANLDDDGNPINSNDDDAEPEFRKLFAVVENRLDGKYVYVEKAEPAPGTVRPLSREMGIEIKFNPQYLLARGHWSAEAEPSKWPSEEIFTYGFNWKKIIATVFIETDQYNQLTLDLNEYENKRTLTIEIPDAELWYLVPGTVLDIDANGQLVKFDDAGDPTRRFLRDDRNKLRAAMAAAKAWYGKEHNKMAVTIQGIDVGAPLGTLIIGGDVTGVGAADSVVTSVRWYFEGRPPQTVVSTDFAPLNIASVLSGTAQTTTAIVGGTVSTPAGLITSKKVEKLEKDIKLLFNEVNLHTVRQEPERLKEVYAVRKAVAKENSPAATKIRCNLCDDKGREIEYGEQGVETNVDVYCLLLADAGVNLADCTPDVKAGDPLVIVKLPYWDEGTESSHIRWYCLFWFAKDKTCNCIQW